MHLKYTEILAIVVHECETWSQGLRIINDFVFWNPYFIALQDFNYSETWRSYETTTNLENIIFFLKKLSSGTFQNYSLICLGGQNLVICVKVMFLESRFFSRNDLIRILPTFLRRLKLLWGEYCISNKNASIFDR